MVVGFDGVSVCGYACDLFEGVFGGESFGAFVGSDLFAPSFFEEEGPEFDAFDYSEVEEAVFVGGHAVVNDHLVGFAVAEELGTVGSVGVGFLGFEQAGEEAGFGGLAAEEEEDGGEVGVLDVELDEGGDVGGFLFGVDAYFVGLEVEEH